MPWISLSIMQTMPGCYLMASLHASGQNPTLKSCDRTAEVSPPLSPTRDPTSRNVSYCGRYCGRPTTTGPISRFDITFVEQTVRYELVPLGSMRCDPGS